MKVLITGASGFIGSSLIKRFVEAGYEVIATARESNTKLEDELCVPVLTLDLLKPNIDYFPQGIELIIHTATANDIISNDFEKGVTLSVNGTYNLLQLALCYDIKRILFFSTLQVYGTELRGMYDENSKELCETPYALNHLFGEEVCKLFVNKNGMDISVLRPSNIYGVPDSKFVKRHSLVPMCFVKSAIEEKKIVLKSSGKQYRNFISTDEVADICLELANKMPHNFKKFIVASNFTARITDIAKLVADVFRERYGNRLKIHKMSEEPREENKFILNTNFNGLVMSNKIAQGKLRVIVHSLFDYYLNMRK